MKTGKWGRTDVLPDDVRRVVGRMQSDDCFEDWMAFRGDDGQDWLVARLYDDETHYSVVAAVVRYERVCE